MSNASGGGAQAHANCESSGGFATATDGGTVTCNDSQAPTCTPNGGTAHCESSGGAY